MTEAATGVIQGPCGEMQAGKRVLPSCLQPCQHLDSSPMALVLDFQLQNYKIVILCCLEPLSLWINKQTCLLLQQQQEMNSDENNIHVYPQGLL